MSKLDYEEVEDEDEDEESIISVEDIPTFYLTDYKVEDEKVDSAGNRYKVIRGYTPQLDDSDDELKVDLKEVVRLVIVDKV